MFECWNWTCHRHFIHTKQLVIFLKTSETLLNHENIGPRFNVGRIVRTEHHGSNILENLPENGIHVKMYSNANTTIYFIASSDNMLVSVRHRNNSSRNLPWQLTWEMLTNRMTLIEQTTALDWASLYRMMTAEMWTGSMSEPDWWQQECRLHLAVETNQGENALLYASGFFTIHVGM